MITTVDEGGRLQDFVTSGLSEDEERRLASWGPDGLRLFEHLRDQEAPLRLDDFPGYVRSLGFSADLILCRTFQGTPMRHRGRHVGHFFLGDKEGGGGSTGEDEEVLVLFAAQAAMAIANARTTATSSARGPTSRRSWRPRRSASSCSMPRPATRCRSTARRSASSAGCSARTGRWKTCATC